MRPEQRLAKPIEIAKLRGYPIVSANSWYVERKVVKLRFGNIVRWTVLAAHLKRPVHEVGWKMFALQVDLIMKRATHTTAAEIDNVVGLGAAHLCCQLGLAYRTGDTIIFRDVAKTVGESMMRRDRGLRVLPKQRSRDLLGKMTRLYEAARGVSYFPNGKEEAAIAALRARARDKEIMERWERALLSRLPRVQTVSGLSLYWPSFGDKTS